MIKHIWSYGGGTQSAAIAALIIQGKIDKPDLAVISDTGREVSTTWTYLDNIVQPALNEAGVEIHRLPHSFDGKGYNYVDLWGGKNKDTLLIPAFTNISGKPGLFRGYCSGEWKRDPVKRFARERGIKRADILIGFSIDEMERMRTYDKDKPWNHVYPLYDLKMSRGDCIALVESMGWGTPPRSACWMCPYRSDHEWRDILGTPDFDDAVAFEKEIQKKDPHAFLHRQCIPIDTVDFSAEPDLFAKPCDSGMCFT